jgi:hypothetical protein
MTPRFNKLYNKLLVEMPDVDHYYPTMSYLDSDNKEYYDMIVDDDKLIVEFNGLAVYQGNTISNKIEYNFLDTAKETLVAKLIIGKDLSIDTMWKDRAYNRNLMSDIIINFILKQHPYIQSSNRQSPLAKKFWGILIRYSLENGYACSYIDSGKEHKINNITEFENLKNHIWPNPDVTLKIYSK